MYKKLLQIKQRLDRKRAMVLSVFFILSLLSWLMIKLSRNYDETQLVFTLNYINHSKDKKLIDTSSDKITLLVGGRGFNLMGYKLSDHELDIDISKTNQKKENNFIETSNFFLDIRSQVGGNIFIKKIIPDTIFFEFKKMVTKQLKVIPDTDLFFEIGFQLKDTLVIEPQSIKVTGQKSILDTLKFVKTKLIKIKDIDKKIAVTSDIEKSANLLYEIESVLVEGEVSQISEKVVLVPITTINVPEKVALRLFPSGIELLCKGPFDYIKRLTPDDFKVIADYKDFEKNNDSVYPKILKKPQFITAKSLYENKLEVLVKE